MDFLGWIEFAVAIAALGVSLGALVPMIWQWYLDRLSPWPYRVVFVGRLEDPIGPWIIVLAFRFENHTRTEAFFEVRLLGEQMTGHEVPFHVSVWPSQERIGLYLPVAPGASREVRVSPFGPQDTRKLNHWNLTVMEYAHRNRPITLEWPQDLNQFADGIATDIPTPPSR